MSGLMSLAEVSEYLGVSERTIYIWAREGKIPAFKLGAAWRFRQSDVDEWLENHRSGEGARGPMTDDVDMERTAWQVREMDDEEREALVKACESAIEDKISSAFQTVFTLDEFIDDFGIDAVREAVESLRNEKRIVLSDVKDRDGRKVKIIKRTNTYGW